MPRGEAMTLGPHAVLSRYFDRFRALLLPVLPSLIVACLVSSPIRAQAPGTLVSVAGGGGLGSGPALSSPLPEIGSIAQDSHGNGYGVSRITCVVYKHDPQGNISVFAGNGVCISSGDGGPATQAGFHLPFSVAVD